MIQLFTRIQRLTTIIKFEIQFETNNKNSMNESIKEMKAKKSMNEVRNLW